MFGKNTLVQYQGGGYDGCIQEWNYAYIDKQGEFHNIAATGVYGCDTFAKLKQAYRSRKQDFDLYHLSKKGEKERFGRQAPISHLIGCTKWFVEEFPEITFPVKCDNCNRIVESTEIGGDGLRGAGGIALEYSKVICDECVCEEEDE